VMRASASNECGAATRRKYAKRIGAKMWESQLRKGSLMLAVLATLRHGRLYGPEIRRRLELIAGIEVSEGVMYPILRRLRKTDLIQTEWIDPVDGQPRRYFVLTSDGHRYLTELSNTWNEFAGGMDRMLAMSPWQA
jgi:PadR family transcriptional regulator, regulatory protein PadR